MALLIFHLCDCKGTAFFANMQDFLKKNNRALEAKTFWREFFSHFYQFLTYSPPAFHLVPMDAQWMLKGCSMVACTNLSTLSSL
jgi:hypothetical protein